MGHVDSNIGREGNTGWWQKKGELKKREKGKKKGQNY